ncbi:MAG: PAS domain S-box protein, partial [Nocardioides sp.]
MSQQEQSCRYLSGLQESSLPMALATIDGDLLEVNAALGRLLRRPVESLVGTRWGHPARICEPDGDQSICVPPAAAARGRLAGEFELESPSGEDDGDPIRLRVAWSLAGGVPDDSSCLCCVFVEQPHPDDRYQRQNDFFAALGQRASDVAIIADANGLMVYVSPGVWKVFGYRSDDVVAFEGWDFIHPDDLARMKVVFARVAAGGATETAVLRVRNAAGEWRWVEETMHNCLDTPIGGIVCNLRDITDRIAVETELTASVSLYRTIAENLDEGLWLGTDEGTTVYVNDRMGEILGVATSDVRGQSLEALLDPLQYQLVRDRHARRSGRGPDRFELPYQHPDGTARTLWIAVAPIDSVVDGQAGFLAMLTDVTRTRQLENELRRAAVYDSLTGLPNRKLLMDRLTRALDRETTGTAAFCVDLDQFKVLNDAHGHAAGNDVLVLVADRLKTCVRPSDTVARLGADEFLVICEDVDNEAAVAIARDLHACLAVPVTLSSGGVFTLTASIGVAMSPPHTSEFLVRNANT